MNLDELSGESILLLYQSGELPEDRRAQVQYMLEHDAAMRSQLEALIAAHGATVSAFRSADAIQPMPASEVAAATRNTVREIRQWQTERAARPQPRARQRGWRIDWRAYAVASASAAVLAVGLFVLFGTADDDLNPNDTGQSKAQAEAEELPLAEQYAAAIDRAMLPPAHRSGELEQTEAAMARLRDLTELSRSGNLESELQ